MWYAFTAASPEEAEVAARRIEQFARARRHERDGVEAITVLRDSRDFFFSPLAARAFAPLVELYRAAPRTPAEMPPLGRHARRFSWRAGKWGSVEG